MGWLIPEAAAQVGTVTRQQVGNFVGGAGRAGSSASCSDSTYEAQAACTAAGETWTPAVTAQGATGIYELTTMVQTGVLVAFGLAVVVAGFMVGRKILRYVRGAG